jgi:hypothetical protein
MTTRKFSSEFDPEFPGTTKFLYATIDCRVVIDYRSILGQQNNLEITR